LTGRAKSTMVTSRGCTNVRSPSWRARACKAKAPKAIPVPSSQARLATARRSCPTSVTRPADPVGRDEAGLTTVRLAPRRRARDWREVAKAKRIAALRAQLMATSRFRPMGLAVEHGEEVPGERLKVVTRREVHAGQQVDAPRQAASGPPSG